MIASVKGAIVARNPDHVVIECGGVGYRLNVSAQTLHKVPRTGGKTRLLSHLVVRDDALQLYGFASEAERDLFLKLISVAGVGPKMALAVLSGSSANELAKAIGAGDAKRFQIVPGVGKKTAERIIIELREKVPEGFSVAAADQNGSQDARVLARQGLVGLGYDLAEAQAMLDAVPGEEGDGEPERLIAAALRAALRKG